MTNPYQIENVQLNAAQLLRAVNGLIKYRSNVTWPTLARWRKHWKHPKPPYTFDDAKIYAHYGDLLALGFGADDAKKYTIEHFTKSEKSNEQPDLKERSATIIDIAPATPTPQTEYATGF